MASACHKLPLSAGTSYQPHAPASMSRIACSPARRQPSPPPCAAVFPRSRPTPVMPNPSMGLMPRVDAQRSGHGFRCITPCRSGFVGELLASGIHFSHATGRAEPPPRPRVPRCTGPGVRQAATVSAVHMSRMRRGSEGGHSGVPPGEPGGQRHRPQGRNRSRRGDPCSRGTRPPEAARTLVPGGRGGASAQAHGAGPIRARLQDRGDHAREALPDPATTPAANRGDRWREPCPRTHRAAIRPSVPGNRERMGGIPRGCDGQGLQ